MARPWQRLGCFAVLAVFVIENHCGLSVADREALAGHFLERGHFRRALIEARRAAREDGSRSDSYVLSALAHLGLEQAEESVLQMGKAIRLSPEDPRLYAVLRQICLEQGRPDLARDFFEELLAETPDNLQARSNLGWSLSLLDATDDAVAHLQTAADADSSLDSEARLFTRLQLGRIYLGRERYEEASQVLQDAVACDDGDGRSRLALGECRLRLGEDEAAEEQFSAVLDMTPDPGPTATHIAQICYDSGRRRRAIDYYELALSQGDDRGLVLNNLAWTYAGEGLELARAAELSLAAIKAEADNIVYLDTYAEILHLLGRHDRALAIIRRALSLEPETGEHHQYLQEQQDKFRLAAASSPPTPDG